MIFAARAGMPLIKIIIVCFIKNVFFYLLNRATDGMLRQDYPASFAAMAPTITCFALAIAINYTLE